MTQSPLKSHYFSPGPASLPQAVMRNILESVPDTFQNGVSILEVSHRSKHYIEVNDRVHTQLRKVLQIPVTHEVMLTPFGAQQHFCLLPQNFSLVSDTIAHADTGLWSNIARKEAENSGRKMCLAFQGGPDYVTLGKSGEYKVDPNSKYLHLTINNTVYGTEYETIPSGFGVPLILDMTSSLAARSDIPWNETACIYASAQKNFGIAGCSVVIVRKDILEESRTITKQNHLGNALSYHAFFDAKSVLNTPPAFANYVVGLYMDWIEQEGGVVEMERRALAKAKMVYSEMDGQFYVGRCLKEHRSRHNFVFRLPTPELDAKFISEAEKNGLLEVKGYRTTGGIRCSMYNGVTLESAEAFQKFMVDFRKANG
jgi:phosphoserine aminotransferase